MPTKKDTEALRGTPAQRAAQQSSVTGSGLVESPEQAAPPDRVEAPVDAPDAAVSAPSGPVEQPATPPVRQENLGDQSINGGPETPAPPVAPAPVRRVDQGLVGTTVHFVMPTDLGPPYRERDAQVMAAHFGERLDLDVATILDEDGIPSPYRYPAVLHDEDGAPGTWHF